MLCRMVSLAVTCVFMIMFVAVCQSCFVPIVFANDNHHDVVFSKAFVLVDENGTPRASLEFENGNPVFGITGTNGKSVFSMGVIKNRPSIILCDEDGIPKLFVLVDKDGLPRIGLWNDRKEPAMMLMISKKDEPKLIMFDKDVQPKLMASISNGQPSIGFMEHKRQLSFAIGLNKDNEPLMFFRDRDGKVDFALSRKYGEPQMYFGRNIDEQLYMGTPHGVPYIGVKHGGRMVWSAHPPGVLVPDIPDTSFKLDDMMDLMHQ